MDHRCVPERGDQRIEPGRCRPSCSHGTEERHSLLSTAKLVLENNMILIPIESQVVGLSENQALTPSASPTSMTSTPMVFKNNEDPEYVTSSLEINRLISDLKGDLKQQNKLLKST
jgi:hypothetical protein